MARSKRAQKVLEEVKKSKEVKKWIIGTQQGLLGINCHEIKINASDLVLILNDRPIGVFNSGEWVFYCEESCMEKDSMNVNSSLS